MTKPLRFKSVKDIREYLAKGGRKNAKTDFQKLIKKASKPIDTKS